MIKKLIIKTIILLAICLLSSLYIHALDKIALAFKLGTSFDSSMLYHKFTDAVGESLFFVGIPFVLLESLKQKIKITSNFTSFLLFLIGFSFTFIYGSGAAFNFNNIYTLIFLSSFFIDAIVYSLIIRKLF